MEFEWDEAKRAANLAKHGLDFADVAAVDWAGATYKPDLRVDYREDRVQAFAMWGERLHQITFTWRGSTMRIMSFRRASRKERSQNGP